MPNKTNHSKFPDPFESIRKDHGIKEIDDQGDPVKMVLRYADVKSAAKDYEAFKSGAKPGRIVVPSETGIRDTRQIPFEVDPPDHKPYRDLLDAWFERPRKAAYQKQLDDLVSQLVDEALLSESIEVVNDFALKLQSRALTLLLDVPLTEAETWINWGVHVFRSDESKVDASKANLLYDYIDDQIELRVKSPTNDLYSNLIQSEFRGRKLTKEEIKGAIILIFAGGRDTVINAITNTIAYLGENPSVLTALRNDPRSMRTAVEELMRYFSPLTHMGRVATRDTAICEHAIKADSRISLCWASANRDEAAFENPNEVKLDRKVNPHLAFGIGIHKCLGATHARHILYSLLKVLAEKVDRIDILDAKENIEDWQHFQRKVGFDSLEVRFFQTK